MPLLWDKKTETIINNESAEIVQMFSSAFNSLVDDKYTAVDINPSQFKKDIEEFNTWIYNNITTEFSKFNGKKDIWQILVYYLTCITNSKTRIIRYIQ